MSPEEYESRAVLFTPSPIDHHTVWEHYAHLFHLIQSAAIVHINTHDLITYSSRDLLRLCTEINADPAEVRQYMMRLEIARSAAGPSSAATSESPQTP